MGLGNRHGLQRWTGSGSEALAPRDGLAVMSGLECGIFGDCPDPLPSAPASALLQVVGSSCAPAPEGRGQTSSPHSVVPTAHLDGMHGDRSHLPFPWTSLGVSQTNITWLDLRKHLQPSSGRAEGDPAFPQADSTPSNKSSHSKGLS